MSYTCVTVYGMIFNSRRDQPGKLEISINKIAKIEKNELSENRTSTSEKNHNFINKANESVGWECQILSHPAPKSSASTIAVLNPLLEASKATAPPPPPKKKVVYTQYVFKALKTGDISSNNVYLHYFVPYTWANLFISLPPRKSRSGFPYASHASKTYISHPQSRRTPLLWLERQRYLLWGTWSARFGSGARRGWPRCRPYTARQKRCSAVQWRGKLGLVQYPDIKRYDVFSIHQPFRPYNVLTCMYIFMWQRRRL